MTKENRVLRVVKKYHVVAVLFMCAAAVVFAALPFWLAATQTMYYVAYDEKLVLQTTIALTIAFIGILYTLSAVWPPDAPIDDFLAAAQPPPVQQAPDRVRATWRIGRAPEYAEDMFSLLLDRAVEAQAVGSDGGSVELNELPPGTIGWTEAPSDMTYSSSSPGTTLTPGETVLRGRWSQETPFAFYRDDNGTLYGMLFGYRRVSTAVHRAVLEFHEPNVIEFTYLGEVGDEPLR